MRRDHECQGLQRTQGVFDIREQVATQSAKIFSRFFPIWDEIFWIFFYMDFDFTVKFIPDEGSNAKQISFKR